MNSFAVSGQILRFPGKYGWYYVELDQDLSKDFRPLLANMWPALLKAEFTLGKTVWQSSIMPIKDGPLFVALPARIRKAERVDEGSKVRITFKLSM